MNILLITRNYPTRGVNKQTNAVHYFAKEWVKLGHKVSIIHLDLRLWKPICLRRKEYGYLKGEDRKREYTLDGVDILLIPLVGYVPLISPHLTHHSARKTRMIIQDYVNRRNIVPDQVIIHFPSSIWSIIDPILNVFSCKPIVTFHISDINWFVTRKQIKRIISCAGKIGVRSYAILHTLERRYGKKIEGAFPVWSGYPDEIVDLTSDTNVVRDQEKKLHKLLYVGQLIPRKNIDITIKALACLKKYQNYSFEIVGSGKSERYLKKLVDQLEMGEQIFFTGQLKRLDVLNKMLESDCFIMVSKPETFGIVYAEAIGCGCLVIGSKGEGIDGIIQDKINGLLVEPESVEALIQALKYYFELDRESLQIMLEESHLLASNLKESTVALSYIKNISR